MDFKKAYEDALERAKCIYNDNPSSSTAKFVCGQIFPEIKESEDEKIRKELIDFVNHYRNNTDLTTEQAEWTKKAIAYLEKQNAEFIEYGRQEYLRGRTEAIDEQKPAEWSGEDESDMKDIIKAVEEVWDKDDANRMIRLLKSEGRQPSKPQLAEGVYYTKDSQPVAEYEDGVETDRLLIIGKYCRFYLSMTYLGIANYKEAQNKAASLGEGWRCPDSFEGRTIGKMSKEIREKAAKIGAEHFKEKGWFWTNELYDRWDAAGVRFHDGDVYGSYVSNVNFVLALSAFQN